MRYGRWNQQYYQNLKGVKMGNVTTYKFEIRENEFLKNSTIGYYSIDFYSYRQSGQLSFLHKLKNNWLKNSDDDLFKSKDEAVSKIYASLMYFFETSKSNANRRDSSGQVPMQEIVLKGNVLVCRIPRSKVNMQDSQLLFQAAIREAIELVIEYLEKYGVPHYYIGNDEYFDIKLIDGINCIKRIKDVPTTHLTGDRAYPGITKDSCDISDEVIGKRILLIDDIYTLGVGVVEDCIQALYDKGAERVIFYAVGRTVKNSNIPATEVAWAR